MASKENTFETINDLEVEVVDYSDELAKKNLKENDWENKMIDGRGI